ncbi:MAG TPA: porin family protein [Bryobacteraceae bacterium]|nr:porin family protein [Bryobacteraceae bacterium]
MISIFRSFGCALLSFAVFGATPLVAQDFHHFTFNVGGGFTGITGSEAGKLDHGGNFQVGAGYNINPHFGFVGNFMFNQLGITGQQLDALQQPDGNARVYSFTVDPTFRFPLFGSVQGYALFGGGWMRRTVQFTKPTLAQITIFDPWWGYYGPALIPVNQILGSVSSNAGVVEFGAGMNIPLPRMSAKLFIEGRYMHGYTENSPTTIVPLTVGLRW